MACYDRNREDMDKTLGKAGHSFTIVAEESTHQNEDAAEAKKSDSESAGSSSEGSSESEDETDNQKEGGNKSDSSSSEEDDSEDSSSSSEEEKVEESKATHIVKEETDEGKKDKPVSRQSTYTASAEKPAVKNAETGFDQRNHDSFKSMQLGGKKIQNFCCCGSIATTSSYVLLPLMLIAAEMCDKTQIVAVSMAPNYGFQSIVIGGIFAQFFSMLFACFLSQILKECIATRFWMDILAALLFLAFGLYELIGELIMENSGTWAERKV
jgi:putative Ca2+/H+ antiporter (TMEM165/GDT1 family)